MELDYQQNSTLSVSQQEILAILKKYKIKDKFIQEAIKLAHQNKFQQISQKYVTSKQRIEFLKQTTQFTQSIVSSKIQNQNTKKSIIKILQKYEVQQQELQTYCSKILNKQILFVMDEALVPAEHEDFLNDLKEVITLPQTLLSKSKLPEQLKGEEVMNTPEFTQQQITKNRSQRLIEKIVSIKNQIFSYDFLDYIMKNQLFICLFNIGSYEKSIESSNLKQNQLKKVEEAINKWRSQNVLTSQYIQVIQQLIQILVQQQKQQLIQQIKIIKEIYLEKENLQIKQYIKKTVQTENYPSKKQLFQILTTYEKSSKMPKSQISSQQYENYVEKIRICLKKLDYLENLEEKKQYKTLEKRLDKNQEQLRNQNINKEILKQVLIQKENKLSEELRHIERNSYFEDKIKILKLIYLELFYNANIQQISEKYIKILQVCSKKTYYLEINQNYNSFKEKTAQKCKINDLEKCILTINEDEDQQSLFTSNQLIKQIQSMKVFIKVYQGQFYKIKIGQESFNIAVHKSNSIEIIKQIVQQILEDKKLEFDIKNIIIQAILQNKTKCLIQKSLIQTENNEKLKVQSLNANIIVDLTINCDESNDRYECSLFSSISQLKSLISKTKGVPPSQLSLFMYKHNNERQQDEQKNQNFQKQLEEQIKLSQIKKNYHSLHFQMKISSGLLHFGFRYPQQLKLQQFNSFFIQKSEDQVQRFKNFRLNQNNENEFLHQILPYLYSAIKKRFNCEDVTQNIRKIIYENTKHNIWMNEEGSKSTFNAYFIITYLLANSEPKLRITLMNLLKTNYSIPMYFRSFKDIHNVLQQDHLNKQLLWILHPSFTIVSMGYHSQNQQKVFSKQSGKSFLINKLFYTSFPGVQTKHQLNKRMPDIFINAYSKYYDMNIIDIPRGTTHEKKHEILSNSNMLILHSWQKKDFTQEKVSQLQKTYPHLFIVSIIRDANTNINKVLEKIQKSSLENGSIITLSNLSRVQDNHNIYNILKRKINTVFQITYQKSASDIYHYTLYNLFQNQLFKNFQKILRKLQKKMFELKVIYPEVQKLKLQQKFGKNDSQSQSKINQLKKQIFNKELNSDFHQIMQFISKESKNSDLLISRLREKLRLYKYYAEKPFNQIYQFKKIVQSLDSKNQQSFQKQIKDIQQRINQIDKINIQIIEKPKNQVIAALVNLGNQIQGSIKPEIFSIELAWRQLIYLAQQNPNYMIGQRKLSDFLIDIKKKDIQNCQPFELIDGDMLQMPKKLMTQVFNKKDKKVAVISILGPQSSGKSTLFNFLFGCDFATSQGRCTRGVYGTYFELTQRKFFNCDAIFLIDTQGLFSILNKKDEKIRRDFDSKLVLFCLGISDFAIINTKGNIDHETQKKLRIAMQKFDNLVEQNISPPEFFLILNQNNSSSSQTSYADINKLNDIFPQKNSYQLPQAYQIQQIDSDQIHILKKSQRILKRKSKPDFMKSCMSMLDQLITSIRKKPNNYYKTLPVIIQQMQRFWSTIEEFPDLASGDSKKVRELQEKIKEWKAKRIQQIIEPRIQNIIISYKAQVYTLSRAKQQFQNASNDLIQAYRKVYPNTDKNQDQRAKISSQESNLSFLLDNKMKQLQVKIKQHDAIIDLKKTKQQGNNDLFQAIKQVRMKQSQSQRPIQDLQKSQIFQKYFNKTLQRTKKTINPETPILQSFQTIKDYYRNAMRSKSIDKQNIGLPKDIFDLKIEQTFQQYQKYLLQNIHKKFQDSSSVLQFTSQYPTKVLSGGNSDATFKYFKMVDYFQKDKSTKGIFIKREDIQCSLKSNQLYQNLHSYFMNIDDFKLKNYTQMIFQNINKVFRNYGFQICNFSNFYDVFNQKVYNLQNVKNKSRKILKIKQAKQYFRNQKRDIIQEKNFVNEKQLKIFIQNFKKNNQQNEKKKKKKKEKKKTKKIIQRKIIYRIRLKLNIIEVFFNCQIFFQIQQSKSKSTIFFI